MDLQKLEQIKALRAKYRVGDSDEKALGTSIALGLGANYLAGRFAAPLIHKIGKHAGEVYRDLKEQVGKGGRVERSINEGKPLNEIPHSDPNKPVTVKARKVDSIPTVVARKVPDVPPLLTPRKDRPGKVSVKPLTVEEKERRAENIILPKMAESRRQGFRGPGSSPNTRKGSIYGQVKKPSTGKLDLSALRSGDNQMEYDLTGSKPTRSFQAPRKEGATHSENPSQLTARPEEEYALGETPRSMPINRSSGVQQHETNPYVSPKGPPSSTRPTQPSPVQEGEEESGPVVTSRKPLPKYSPNKGPKRFPKAGDVGGGIPIGPHDLPNVLAGRKVVNKPKGRKLTAKQQQELDEQEERIRAQEEKKSFGDVEEKAMDIDTKAVKKKPLPKELQGLPRSAVATTGKVDESGKVIPSRPLTRAEQKLVKGPQKATGSTKRELPRGTVNFGPLARTVNETPEQIATINKANAEIEARERAGKPKKMGKREGQQLARNAPSGTSTTVGGRLKEGVRYDKEGNIQPQKYYGIHSQQAGQAPKRGSKPHDIPDVPLGSGHGKIDLGVDYARSHVGKQEQEERPFSKPLKEASYGRVSHRAHPHLSGSVASTPLAHPTGTIDVSEKRPAKASMRVVSGMADEPRRSQHGEDVEGGEEFVARGSPHYPQATPVRRDNRLANAARKVGGAIARGAGAVASRLGLVGSMKLGRERKAPELVQGPQQPKDRKPQGMTISRNYGRALNELGVRNQGESEQEKASRAAMQSTTRKIAEAGMQQHRQTRMANTSLPGYQTGYQPSQSFTHSKAGKSTTEGYNAARERMRERTGKSMTIQNRADSFADRIGLVKAARPVVGPKMPPHIAKRRAAEAAGGYVVGGATAQESVGRNVGRAKYQRKIGMAPDSGGVSGAYYGAPQERVSRGGQEIVGRGGQEIVGRGGAARPMHSGPERVLLPGSMKISREQARRMGHADITHTSGKHLSDDQTRAEKFMGRLARKNNPGSLGAAGGLELMAEMI